MAINELRSISIFVSAAELGSLRKAAAALDISPQAASQALSQLEQHLDVRLFHRTTRVMALTDEGRRFLEEAQPSLMGLRRALQSVKRAREEIAGPLRIVGPRSTFQPIIWRLLEEFCQEHPDIQPDVQLEDRVGNWVEDRVDVGFRLGQSAQEGVIARRLFPVQLIICASPTYLQRYGAPGSLAALASHRCSVYRNPGTGKVVPMAPQGGRRCGGAARGAGHLHQRRNPRVARGACRAVLGQLAGVTAAPYIRSGQLVPLLVDHMPERSHYFIYFGSRSSQPARARAFIDLTVKRLVDNREYVLDPKELKASSYEARRA